MGLHIENILTQIYRIKHTKRYFQRCVQMRIIVPYILIIYQSLTLREKCPYSEFLWSVFSQIPIEYGEIQSISPYSVRIRENTDHKNSEYEHFSRSARLTFKNILGCILMKSAIQEKLISKVYRTRTLQKSLR